MAGQNADMTLKVGLDLNFFKQELQKASSSLAGEPVDINVRFNKKSIGDQYNLLSRWLRAKKTFDIKIESNTLNALIDKVANFQKTLKNLKDEKIELNVTTEGSTISKQEARKIRTKLRGDILSRGGKILIPATIAPAITKADVNAFRSAVTNKFSGITVKVKAELESSAVAGAGVSPAAPTVFSQAQLKKLGQDIKPLYKAAADAGLVTFDKAIANNIQKIAQQLNEVGADSIAGLLDGLKSGDTKIKAAAENLGETLIASIKAVLGIASPSREFKKIGQNVGEGFQQGMMSSMDKAFDAVEGLMRARMKVLNTIARGMFRMAGIDPAALRAEAAQRRALPGVNFPATIPPRSVSVGPSSTGRALPAGPSAAGLLGGARPPAGLLPAMSVQSQIKAIVDALVAQQGPRALSSGGGQLVDTKRIYAALRKNLDEILQRQFTVIDTEVRETSSGIKDAMGAFSYLVQALKDAEARTKDARIDDAVVSLMREIEGAIKLAQARARIIPAQVADLGATQRMLQGQRIAGLLPAGVGRAPSVYSTGAIDGETRAEMMARREREARMRSDLRGMDVMGGGAGRPPAPYSQAYRSARPRGAIVPYATAGALVSQPQSAGVSLTGQATPFATPLPKNYLEIGKAIKGLDPMLQKSSVPFSGAIRELGEEFGFALKQVLLFGTAYKALAFFTDLPSQALKASTELQSFNNQLNAITGSSSNAERSVAFINDTVAQFNIPLQSAREGFLRLYASMSPAGMGADTIENLFVGISQASATLGLSANQVDRVTYAFSQMASKGKVMSEEVTGQLGDVIPGALSLMADAAGMSMADFKQAMEDGQVSGKAMEQLFTNLPIVMQERFGKGAAGAAKTLQGQLNDLATTTQKMYEAFEPLVTSIANQVLPAVSTAMKDTQAAVAAFGLELQGINPAANLLSEGAQNLYRNFKLVYDTASSVAAIIQSLGGVFSTLGGIISGSLQLFNAIAANPVGEFFVKLAVNIGIATAAINLFVKSGIIAAAQQLLLFIGNLKLTIASLRTLITTSRAAKIAVGGIVAGGIMVLFEMLATHIASVRDETDKLKNSALAAADALKQMSYEQLISEERNIKRLIANLETLQKLAGGGLKITRPTKEQEQIAKELGLAITGRAGQRAISMVRAEGVRQQLFEKLPAIKQALESPGREAATTITPIDLEAGKGESAKEKGKVSLERLVSAGFAQRAAVLKAEMELAKEQTAALAPDTAQAGRMLKYYSELRQTLIDMAVIQAQIEDAEKNRAAYIKDGMSAEQLNYNLQELRNQLQIRSIELIATEQKYRNEAAKDAAKEAEERRKEQEKFASTLLDIKNENGFISTQEYNRLKIDEQIRKILEELPSLTEQQKKEIEAIIRNKQTQLKVVKEEIELLRAVNDAERRRIELQREGYTKEKIEQIINLEKVRDNIQATREIIDNFVTDTSSDYKGFLKEVISGEDAVDALKKFQEGLKDRVLTIFLDFTMAPVEKFFKEVAGGNLIKALFPESAEDKAAAAQANNTTALGTVKTAIELATNAINNLTTTIGGGIGVPSSVNTASFGVSNVGNDLASQLMNERGYEDVAGLLPLPLEKMRQQAARPLRMIWQQIQGAMEGAYGIAEKEVKKTFKPNPAIHQKVLQGIQRVESFRAGPNTWDPGEAQWKERENRWREDKRSKPSSMPLQSFMTTATQMRDSLSEVVQKAGGFAVSSGTRLGSQLDLSDYLSEQQKKILATGVKEVLNSAMNASFQELRGSAQSNRDPSRMPSFENATSRMQNLLPSFRTVIEEALSQEAAKGQRYAMDAMKKFGMQAPVDPSFYRSLEYLDPSRGQERLRELSPLNEPPRINLGIESQFEGASLPFNMQKMSTSYGQVATIGGLNGLVDGGNLLEMAGVNLESFASNVETFKAGTENLNSSMEGVVNSTYTTAQQMSPEGDAGNQFMKALGATVQGIGIAAGSIMGIMAGINQVKEGGTSNVLGGIGMIASAAGSLLGGISSLGGMFKGGGGGASAIVQGVDIPASALPPGMAFANGGIARGGFIPFRAFANGGAVTGPTLGLVGEGRYNEAVVPLPDGKSIPVQLGGKSARDLMGGNAPGMPAAPALNMKFETTKINGVEYVSREQLEQAMASTRRLASREGAAQGSQLALNKLKNSPTTRRQLGL